MNQKKLSEALGGVVEDCVNKVGVDLNTASASLLEYISGITKVIAKNIVDYRENNGRFTNRKQLLKVAKLGPKAYEQCAGFLRILDGDNPLDATSVHPESYEAAEKLLDKLGMTMEDVREAVRHAGEDAKKAGNGTAVSPAAAGNGRNGEKGVTAAGGKQNGRKNQKPLIRNTNTAMGKALAAALAGSSLAGDRAGKNDGDAKNGRPVNNGVSANGKNDRGGSTGNASDTRVGTLERKLGDKKKLAEELGIGEITLTDIVKELEKPARDPRSDMPAPILRSDVLDMKDLKPGMILKGTVRNVIDFGVFVDIGVHQDGLVHISRITDRYIRHPLEAVSVGDIVEVKVLDVDVQKKRISLTMRLDQEPEKK